MNKNIAQFYEKATTLTEKEALKRFKDVGGKELVQGDFLLEKMQEKNVKFEDVLKFAKKITKENVFFLDNDEDRLYYFNKVLEIEKLQKDKGQIISIVDLLKLDIKSEEMKEFTTKEALISVSKDVQENLRNLVKGEFSEAYFFKLCKEESDVVKALAEGRDITFVNGESFDISKEIAQNHSCVNNRDLINQQVIEKTFENLYEDRREKVEKNYENNSAKP